MLKRTPIATYRGFDNLHGNAYICKNQNEMNMTALKTIATICIWTISLATSLFVMLVTRKIIIDNGFGLAEYGITILCAVCVIAVMYFCYLTTQIIKR